MASSNATTPYDHISELRLDGKVKNRVKLADRNINNSRCLIENCIETKAVEFCHCFPRWKSYREKNALMDSLEWFWNMKHRTLNLDTRQNIFRAGASLHSLFDQHYWMLLPDPSIVQRYYDTLFIERYADRESFLVIDDSVYEYRFISILPEMFKVPLIRQINHNDLALGKTGVIVHAHPYPDMPMLKSHIHPKFVILQVGYTLLRMGSKAIKYFIEIDPHPDQLTALLQQILHLYRAWITGLPRKAFKDESFNYRSKAGDESTQGDNASDRTPLRRVKDPRFKQAGDDDTNYYPTASLEQRIGRVHTFKQAYNFMSRKSLKLHDKQLELEGKKWTSSAIRNWSKQCHPLPISVHTPWQPTGICI